LEGGFLNGRKRVFRALKSVDLVEIEAGIRSGAALGVETLISVNSGRVSSIGRHSLDSEDEMRGSMVSAKVSLDAVAEGKVLTGGIWLFGHRC
jgi:hypothetical protein